MKKKVVTGIMLTLLISSMLAFPFSIQLVKATGMIYIRADGSVEPESAPILSGDNVTYTLTGNINNNSVVVERDNIVVDGAGYTLQGTESGTGLDLSGRNNVTIKNIEIKDFNYGIVLSSAWNITIYRNNIANNIIGIELHMASNNVISRNNVATNYNCSILLGSSSNNTISGNNIIDNGDGVTLSWSADNAIYHNNFIDSTCRQVWITASGYANFWDDGYPSGGNYWSDYNGTDFYSGPYQNETDSDEIGDTPYVIDDYNQDNYPLILPYGPVRNLNTDLVYLTIQSAINAPETSDGHTIFVSSGTYYEKVVINKALNLIGEDRSSTIIDGDSLNYTGALVTIEVDNVDFAGFTVTDALNESILVVASQYCEVRNNIVCFTGDRGIRLEGGGNNTVYNNIVYNSSAYGGIEAINSDNNTIYNNLAYFNQWGIATNHGSYNHIYNNTVHSNRGTGIHIDWPSTENIVSSNNVSSNTEIGICVMHQASKTVIEGNKISGCVWGINLENSLKNSISGNTITTNTGGIGLYLSSNNSIIGNDITDNECGVHIHSSSSNRFFHNNFKYNTRQVIIVTPGDANFWDDGYPSGGNYWSDYMGLDFYSGPYQNETDSDEIGDMAYVIDENNQDHYPLVKPWQVPITIGTTSNITILDPAAACDLCTREVFNNIGEGLLKYKPGTTELVYGIAENYTVSHDALNYTFKLREGMYFTDGEPLDATAVKWSIDRVISLNLDYPSWLVSNFVDSIEVLDALTIKFVLKKAGAYFPALVATLPYFPVSSKSYPANETAESMVGHYGPYRIKSWTRDVEIVLEANPDYYGAQPKSKYCVIKFFENGTTLKQALENGVIDIAWKLGLPDIVDLIENPDFKVFETLGAYTRFIALRCNMTPFDDARLRRAVAAAINRTRICTEVYMGTTEPLYSAVPGELWSHIDAFKDEYGVRNLTLARELLTAAGYNETRKFEFDLWHPPMRFVDVVAIIKSDLEETGMMNVTLKSAEWATYVDNMLAGVMPIFLFYWGADYLDPDNFLTPFLYSELSPDWGMFYNNTKMDDYLEDALVELNVTRRAELYEDAQRLLAEEAPLVPLYEGTFYAVARPNIEGVYLSPTMFLPYYTIYRYVPSTRYPWPMFRHDLRHTGYTESPAPNTNQTLWNYTTGYFVQSSPAVASGMVFVGSNDRNVYALDQYTGAHIWNYTTGGSVCSSPAVVDGKVYVGSFDKKVYCLDASTGVHIWNYTTGAAVGESSPVVVDGKVYVGSLDYKVYCLDASTGVHIWNYTTGLVSSSPAVAYGKVYVGSYDAKVYCLDASTGALIWNHTTGGTVGSSPAVVDGRVYVGSDDYNVYCLNASSGAHIWNYTTGGAVRSSPAVVDGRVYVGSYDAKVYCLDAATGAHIWNHTVGSSVRSSPVVASGMVFVGSNEGKVYALDQYTGAHIWNYTTGSHVYSSPAIADGMLFVGSDDYTVYAFGNIIRVPEDYPTVQEAIDAADEGATIIVAPGIYYESLVINKTVTIIGEPGSAPIFDGGGSGIAITLLPEASGSTIANIVITNWDQGIVIVDSSDCDIYETVMSHMKNSGIALEGIYARDNVIHKNIFQDNTVAIDLTESSTNNEIYANTISENTVGIDLSNSDGNIIYHNNFIGNTVQVNISTSTGNIWHNGYPSGGNYWSNQYHGDCADHYNGPNQDILGSDGIVDTEYKIDDDNIDRYPLMNPLSGIGITNLITSKTIIGQGYTSQIHLRILNYGVHNEISTLTVYANTTIIATQTIILTNRSSTAITFLWNTAEWAKGNYTMTATASSIPDEMDIADNTLIDGTITVTIPGDVDGDFDVDLYDAVAVCGRYGAKKGGPRYDPNCDINGNDKIFLYDAVIVGAHYGQKYP